MQADRIGLSRYEQTLAERLTNPNSGRITVKPDKTRKFWGVWIETSRDFKNRPEMQFPLSGALGRAQEGAPAWGVS